MRKRPIKLMMDSGAYSAWKVGTPVSLQEYTEWLQENHQALGVYVALDEIDTFDREGAARKSFANLEYMMARGLRPVPVLHAGEDFRWLERMLALGCDYIGLSGTSLGGNQRAIFDWYAAAWEHLVTDEGLPVVQVHAFGESTLPSLLAFPWKSADSASWIYGALRTATFPLPGKGRVAQRHDGYSDAGAVNYSSLDFTERAELERVLRAVGLRHDALDLGEHEARTARIILAVLHFAARQGRVREKQPIRFAPASFFSATSHRPAIAPFEFEFYLATGGSAQAFPALAWVEHEHFLFSYFYLKSAKAIRHHLLDYVQRPKEVASTAEGFSEFWKVLQRILIHEGV